jgi:hypothetical protein
MRGRFFLIRTKVSLRRAAMFLRREKPFLMKGKVSPIRAKVFLRRNTIFPAGELPFPGRKDVSFLCNRLL